MTRPIALWSEIPVTDLTRSVAFYNSVFGYDMQISTAGPNPIAVLGSEVKPGGGHLYAGTPAAGGAGSTIHLAVPDNLADASDRCRSGGGEVLSDPIARPDGRIVYARDPDGNSISLYEAA